MLTANKLKAAVGFGRIRATDRAIIHDLRVRAFSKPKEVSIHILATLSGGFPISASREGLPCVDTKVS